MIIWQASTKGEIKIRLKEDTHYKKRKRKELQIVVAKTYRQLEQQELPEQLCDLTTFFGWLTNAEAIVLVPLEEGNQIEIFFIEQNLWRHQADCVLTNCEELFNNLLKVL